MCVLPVDAIAALAGCSRTSVKNALRQARLLGLILVKERRIPGRKSLTNIVSIISKEWLGWLKLGGGVKNLTALKHERVSGCSHDCGKLGNSSASATGVKAHADARTVRLASQ